MLIPKSKVTVLLSVYANSNAHHLDECLYSLFLQTHLPNEILIIQEGEVSNDINSIIIKWKSKFQELFTYIVIPFQNGPLGYGLPACLNYGIKLAKYDYILRMDTDDLCDIYRIEKQLAFADKNPDVDLFGCHILEFDENMDIQTGKRVVPLKHIDIVKFSKFRNPFNGPTVVFKKNVALDLGGYPNVASNEDYCFWALFILNRKVLQNQDEYLVKMRGGDGIINRRSSKRYQNGELMSLKYLKKIGFFSNSEFFLHLFIKKIVRNLPFGFIKLFYKKILR